ncbi:hypothetical protein [Sphingomonas sp.]|jgi:EpsD family peptidyl-prolyl cis-trans isomerase|uniref:hypothetical protein n=1 Tax=Sphingomonas sp. TaxID=28214 RepID=UPI002ED9D630
MSRGWVIALSLALAGCSKGPPTGQVLARVNDVEITRRDVLIELMASGAPADADTRRVQPELLDRIVTRKLLAEEARRLSVDRSPEFLGEERRSRETILAEQLMRRLIGRLPPPSDDAITRFVADNAPRFDGNPRLGTDMAERRRFAAATLGAAAERRLIEQTIARLRAQARVAYRAAPPDRP